MRMCCAGGRSASARPRARVLPRGRCAAPARTLGRHPPDRSPCPPASDPELLRTTYLTLCVGANDQCNRRRCGRTDRERCGRSSRAQVCYSLRVASETLTGNRGIGGHNVGCRIHAGMRVDAQCVRSRQPALLSLAVDAVPRRILGAYRGEWSYLTGGAGCHACCGDLPGHTQTSLRGGWFRDGRNASR
jgi:hypothetical protein